MSGRPPIAPKRGVSVGHGASVGGSTKANSRRPPRSSDVEMSSFMNKSATGGVFSSLPLSGSQSTRLSASSISSAILAGVFTITLVVILLVLQRVNTMQLPTSSSAGGGRIRDGERGLTSSPRDLAERKTDGKSTNSGSKGRDDGEQQAGGNKKAVEKAKEKPQANSNNDGKGDSRDGFPASSSSSSFFSSDDNENDNADDTLEGIDADSIAMGADRGKLEDTSVSSSDAQTKPSATKTDNRAPDKKKVKKVWCKGSWVRFGLNNNNNNGGAESSGSSGNAEGGGGNGGNKNTVVFENGVPRGLCTPFPSVSGLAASCNLQPLLTSLQEQQQQQGGESAEGQASKGSGVSPPPPEKGAAVNALLQFQIDVVEGLTVHEVKCTAGCTKATFSVSSSSSAGEAVDGSAAAAATEASGSVTKPTLSPFKFTKGIVSIASVGDLTGRCGPNSDNNEKQQGDGACIIAFDLLVSYNSGDQMRSNGEGRESVSRRGASTKGAADDSNFPPMCFLSVGDWGSHAVKPVADQMAIDAERYFAKFIISTGDNFYPVGVKSITDPHWEKSFEKPFSSPFLKFVRWYISAGNHDQWGLGPQLEYGKTHPRWYFPSPFYNDEVPIHEDFSLPTAGDASASAVSKGNAVVGVAEGQGGGSNVEAPPALISSSSSSSQQLVPASSTSIFLTVLDYNGRNKNHQIAFLDAVHRDKYKELSGLSSIDNRNVPLNPPPSSDPSKVEAEGGQRDVVEAAAVAQQQRKKYMWKGIVNHPLLFGGSSHGLHVETVHNRAQLKPTIDKHNVHWHLSGHDHILEILKSDKTDYLISGAGGGSKMYTSSKVAETIWWQGEGVTMRGFMRHCVYGHEKMTTTVIDDKGVEHYTHTTLYDN